MGGGDVEAQLVDEPGQARRLALRQVEHQTGESRGVDDRVLERALQAASHKPRVERVVAVLHQHRPLRETQETSPGVLELRRADEHRAIDVVAPTRVRVDGRPAVDKGVEEGKRAVEPEALGSDLEDKEWRVARGLDVERDELSVVERGLRADLGRVDGYLLPDDGRRRAPRLEEKGLGLHQRANASARRAHAISSPLTALRSSTATI